MKRFLLPFFAALLITAITGDIYADSLNEAKQADIIKLMEITGVLSLGKQMSDSIVTQMTRVIKASRPDLDPKLFDILREEVNSVIEENLPKFTAQLIPVYDKYFTHQDIKEMIQVRPSPYVCFVSSGTRQPKHSRRT